jgi:hypothetical protein
LKRVAAFCRSSQWSIGFPLLLFPRVEQFHGDAAHVEKIAGDKGQIVQESGGSEGSTSYEPWTLAGPISP